MTGKAQAARPVRTTASAWWADAIASAAAVSLLVVVALWVRGGGVQALRGWAAGLTSLGRLTGLVAADLLLIQVPARGLRSVTVIGPSLTWADVYATAAAAQGPPAVTWLATLPGDEALLVGDDGAVLATPGWAPPG